ncbi:hypothetical protein MKEN_00486300 [Mycena kentingensis (nom. inval.)]|nr:hypothetical protein MKEN_00486300 [Mycena kentingensis (nom. inval.)]
MKLPDLATAKTTEELVKLSKAHTQQWEKTVTDLESGKLETPRAGSPDEKDELKEEEDAQAGHALLRKPKQEPVEVERKLVDDETMDAMEKMRGLLERMHTQTKTALTDKNASEQALSESKIRLSTLKKELKNAKKQLEAAKAEVAVNQAETNALKEQHAESVSNIRAESEQEIAVNRKALKAELRAIKDALTAAEGRFNDSSKEVTALRRQLEGYHVIKSKAVKYDELRMEKVELQTVHEAEKKTLTDQLAALREKYEGIKAGCKTLKQTSAEQETEVASLRAQLEAAVSKDAQQQDLIAKYEQEKKQHFAKAQQEKAQLRKTLEAEIHTKKIDAAVARCAYHLRPAPAMDTLAIPHPVTVCDASQNALVVLAEDPSTARFLNNALFLPNRTLETGQGWSYLAFGPQRTYDSVHKEWSTASDMQVFFKTRRELFVVQEHRGVDPNNHHGQSTRRVVVYAGTYLCVQIPEEIYPTELGLPASIPNSMLMDVAFGASSTLHPSHITNIVNRKYNAKTIPISVMGLEFVGYNQALHGALEKRLAPKVEQQPKEKKRKMKNVEQGEGQGEAKKSRRMW